MRVTQGRPTDHRPKPPFSTVIKNPSRSLTQASSTLEGERLAADLREHPVFVLAVVVAEYAVPISSPRSCPTWSTIPRFLLKRMNGPCYDCWADHGLSRIPTKAEICEAPSR